MKQFIYLAVLLLMVSCSSKTNHNLNSVLWVQTAAEYQANCYQAYHTAFIYVEAALADNRWTGALEQTNDFSDLPPAVIFDLDETVFDNSAYQAQLALDGSGFQLSSWDQWVRMRKAGSIAGAVDFINYAQNQGIEVIFITNRECKKRDNRSSPCPQESDTIENLNALGITGITGNNVLLKHEYIDWGSEKKSRREYIVEKYRVIMIFGDDLGDFIPGVKKEITPEKRKEMAAIFNAYWGTKWFIIPNPMYGSWRQVLKTPQCRHLQGFTEK
ncbi:MAG: acid phosphatase [Desulfobacteraceae bacterium]|nr:acid phosphatase [Desulfobacteraceae bacterium]MBC2757903.1 acid phosphatase [Desulfobacteraceae bacterium]